ncbi:hypothetical protein [Methylobacterium sp. B1]|uniref:hypothetical protein n=1 Tax=Methylobacterium sp. B1 TaxID=91459 RepID=UPI00034D1126|nr:hypothetical protein [Methylobacterium sp. B1]
MTKMQAAMNAAAILARQRTMPQFLAFFRHGGLVHIVDQRIGAPDDAIAWVSENVAGRYGYTPTDIVWLGEPIWAFADEDEAFAFKMRWG